MKNVTVYRHVYWNNFTKIMFPKRCYSIRNKWKSVIGLEVHAQLNTETKLFSGAHNKFGSLVNNCVSLFDASIPGTLPVLNRRCVELGITIALSLSCKINEISMFDRKHYFYADLPAGYQITQQRAPLANDGVIHFQVFTPGVHKKPYTKSSKIKQIQLEQDSGKSLHDIDLKKSLVDLNRAGAPLIEIVFEPDLEDGEEAAALIKELVLIVQRLGACTGRMEEGALRVDANVSIHRSGEPLGTRTEIKNIGSVRGVAGAIHHEIDRQIQVLESGGTVINETRAWDALAHVTIPMRDKEVVQDYRYMPEPNLPPLRVNLETKINHPDVISVPLLQERLPELPEQTRQYLIQKFSLRPNVAIQLVNEPIMLKYFEELMSLETRNPMKVVNVLLNDFLTVLNKRKLRLDDCTITVAQLGEVFDMLTQRKINLEVFRRLLEELLDFPSKDTPINKLVESKGWFLITDDDKITKWCIEVMENNPKMVKQYKGGKVKVLRALLGILANNTNEKYDMSLVSKKLEELLKK